MTHDFTGKAMAVTGSSGIGLGAALYLARSGARVFLAGIDTVMNDKAAALAPADGVGGRRAPLPRVDGVVLGDARVDADLATTRRAH